MSEQKQTQPEFWPPPPMIETVEGAGVEYLIWTRERIEDLLRRVAGLEANRS